MFQSKKHSHYHKEVLELDEIDSVEVATLFGISDSANFALWYATEQVLYSYWDENVTPSERVENAIFALRYYLAFKDNPNNTVQVYFPVTLHEGFSKVNIQFHNWIDVYETCRVFGIKDESGSVHHAIKKVMCSGIRGVKDHTKDISEAIDSFTRFLEIEKFRMYAEQQKTANS